MTESVTCNVAHCTSIVDIASHTVNHIAFKRYRVYDTKYHNPRYNTDKI